jgi:hypothetical protein
MRFLPHFLSPPIILAITATLLITPPARSDDPKPAEQIVPIEGKVLDKTGQPVAGARVVVLARAWESWLSHDTAQEVVASGVCNDAGRFRLTQFKTAKVPWQSAQLLVSAKGCALAWEDLDLYDELQEPFEFKLLPGKEVKARLTTPDSQPLPNLRVAVEIIERGSFVDRLYLSPSNIPQEFYLVHQTTGAQGEIVAGQLPAGTKVYFSLEQEPYIRQSWQWDVDDRTEHVAQVSPAPGQIIIGILTGDTGQPLPMVTVTARTSFNFQRALVEKPWTISSQTDANGKFGLKIPSSTKAFEIQTNRQPGGPYLGNKFSVPAETDLTKELRFQLSRGVLVRGRVVEQSGGKPVPRAGVSYVPQSDNPLAKQMLPPVIEGSETIASEEGEFTLAAVPGKGTLVVWSASADDVLRSVNISQLLSGKNQPGDRPAHAFGQLPIDIPDRAEEISVQVPLQRGLTVRARVSDADGQVPKRLRMARPGRADIYTDALSEDYWPVYHGRLTVRGVPPDGELLVWLLDPERNQGKVFHARAADAGAPLDVKLEPCGSAAIHITDSNGAPVPGYAPRAFASLLALPEDAIPAGVSNDRLVGLDRLGFDDPKLRDLVSDESGRIVVPDLIPGAIYQISFANSPTQQIKVRPGEQLELSNVRITDPRLLDQAAKRWEQMKQESANGDLPLPKPQPPKP